MCRSRLNPASETKIKRSDIKPDFSKLFNSTKQMQSWCVLFVLGINLNDNNLRKNTAWFFVFIAGFVVKLIYLVGFRRQKSLGGTDLDTVVIPININGSVEENEIFFLNTYKHRNKNELS